MKLIVQAPNGHTWEAATVNQSIVDELSIGDVFTCDIWLKNRRYQKRPLRRRLQVLLLPEPTAPDEIIARIVGQ
jgi:hypothetical protein